MVHSKLCVEQPRLLVITEETNAKFGKFMQGNLVFGVKFYLFCIWKHIVFICILYSGQLYQYNVLVFFRGPDESNTFSKLWEIWLD